MQFDGFFDPDLVEQPVKRAAYSDRTAWLMSVMSLFAYLPFEDPIDRSRLRQIAQEIAGKTDVDELVSRLNQIVSPGEGEPARQKLRTLLGEFQFELLDAISITEGLRVDTQCFIARVMPTSHQRAGEEMLVLSFRGTQPTRLADLRTDMDIELMEIEIGRDFEGGVAKVHRGFYNAYRSVEDRIDAILKRDDCRGLPLFITGHSLGGGLAVVATRFVANGARGACYTFGCPRVGNQAFNNQIFTPVYRIVNAADIVTAVPLAYSAMNALLMLLRWIPVASKLAPFFEKIREYRHGGDLRYLGHAPETTMPDGRTEYRGMDFLNNPSLIERWWRSGRRLLMSWGSAGLGDHDITLYVRKLAYYARLRKLLRASLNPRPPAPPVAESPAEKPAVAPAAKPAKKTAARTPAKPAPKAAAKTPAKPAARKSRAKPKPVS
jgi:triacylglycerol lipase